MAKTRTADDARAKAVQDALDRARREVEIPEAWKPEVDGETLIGEFQEARTIRCRDKQGRDRAPLVFFVSTEQGKRTIWGSANLQPQMERLLEAGLTAGQVIAVSYDGTAKTSAGYTVKRYVIAVVGG